MAAAVRPVTTKAQSLLFSAPPLTVVVWWPYDDLVKISSSLDLITLFDKFLRNDFFSFFTGNSVDYNLDYEGKQKTFQKGFAEKHYGPSTVSDDLSNDSEKKPKGRHSDQPFSPSPNND